MSFSFENFFGGSGDWGVSFDFGSTFDFLDYTSWQAELGVNTALGNDPFGFDVDLGSLSHDVVSFRGVGASDIVTTGQIGSRGTNTFNQGITTGADNNSVDFARWVDANNPSVIDSILNSATSLSPLDVVEGVARLAIPGGGFIIDTAENIIAGQDPFTAAINAAQEGVDRVINIATGAFDTVSDIAIAAYDRVSDPVGTGRAVTTATINTGQDAIQTIVVTGQRATSTVVDVALDPIGTLVGVRDLVINTGSRVVDTGVTAATTVAGTVGNLARGNPNVATVLASVSDSLGITAAVEAAANAVARTTVAGLPAGVQSRLESAYESFLGSGNASELNAVLRDNNLTAGAVSLLYPSFTADELNDLTNRGVVFGQPADNLLTVASGTTTTVTGNTVTQVNAISSDTAAVSNSQNNAANVAATSTTTAINTVANLSPAVQAAIANANALAQSTGNYADLNKILADNNITKEALQQLYPELTAADFKFAEDRGLVYGQPKTFTVNTNPGNEFTNVGWLGGNAYTGNYDGAVQCGTTSQTILLLFTDRFIQPILQIQAFCSEVRKLRSKSLCLFRQTMAMIFHFNGIIKWKTLMIFDYSVILL
jgi:hypothetical protein